MTWETRPCPRWHRHTPANDTAWALLCVCAVVAWSVVIMAALTI